MSTIVTIDRARILPERETVYRSQGIKDGSDVHERIRELHSKAMEFFLTTAEPVCITSGLSTGEFDTIFRGEGKNEGDNPLKLIYPKSRSLVLFALTLGSEISATIETLFESREFALGTMLDTVASLAADKAVEVLEKDVYRDLLERGLIDTECDVLSYSAGYCGWDISGQKKLFHYLDPGKIQMTLNDSFLMSPLKSVSGVLVAGEKEIHLFETDYPFCRECETHSCRLRMNRMLES